MKNQTSRYSGVYLQVPSQRNRFIQFLLCGVFIAVAVTILFVPLESEVAEDKIAYHLPDEVPSFNLPENLEDNSDSRDLNDLVVPYFYFIIDAGNHSIDVSLPIIKASYANDFNISIVNQLENLISNTLHHLENDACIYRSIAYEAFLDQEILTVLLHTEYTDGQTRCQLWSYDLSKGGVQINDTCELTGRLLGMDYVSFLSVTDCYIQNLFADTYFDDAYSVPEADMSNDQHEFLDSYRGIVREIPQNISNAFSRWIFPADGKVFLVFQLPQITDDWHTGFRSETRVVEIDKSILKYWDMVTPQEAVLDAILNSTVHVMGATDQAHAQLLRIIFCDSPYTFIDAMAGEPEQDQEYAVSSLLRYADDADMLKLLEICHNLNKVEYLTNDEIQVIGLICSRISSE